jgi:hypothetical protein
VSVIDPKQDRRVSPAQELGQPPKTQREVDHEEYALGDRRPANDPSDRPRPDERAA